MVAGLGATDETRTQRSEQQQEAKHHADTLAISLVSAKPESGLPARGHAPAGQAIFRATILPSSKPVK